MDVMLKLMEGMQMMQKQLLEQKEKTETIETVKAGFAELPRLGEFSPENGPIELGDWFTIIHPLMSDLSDSSMEWWDLLLKEAREWYEEYMKEIPLNRVNMVPKTPEVLGVRKWSRLERRAASLIIQAVPETVRDEMIATNTVSAYGAICRLLVVYQPGGLGEKGVVLRALEEPVEAATIPEALKSLRKWLRWRRRASEMNLALPDPTVMMRGLSKMIRKVVETNRELSFRISLARNTLRVDSVPTHGTVQQFAERLLDSGATHPLRARQEGEDIENLDEIDVALAGGEMKVMRITEGGIIVQENEGVGSIIPLGLLVERLHCVVTWDGDECRVVHPELGALRIHMEDGCPYVTQRTATKLLEELEKKGKEKRKGRISEVKLKKVLDWETVRKVVELHPAFRDLPEEVRRKILVEPAETLRAIPWNRRRRRSLEQKGRKAILHLCAGPREGYTLAWRRPHDVLEIDLQRGPEHDMMSDELYAFLLRGALDSRFDAVVGGPNCRTRSVLRHYPLPGGGPRPVRSPEEPFGRSDLTPHEKKAVWEDDVMMWRMLAIYLVAEEARNAKGGPQVGFVLEPADPRKYMPGCPTFSKTTQWEAYEEMEGMGSGTKADDIGDQPLHRPA